MSYLIGKHKYFKAHFLKRLHVYQIYKKAHVVHYKPDHLNFTKHMMNQVF